MRPKYNKPYYYINNNNIDTGTWDEEQSLTPTNPINLVNKEGESNNSIASVLNNNGTDRMEGTGGPMEAEIDKTNSQPNKINIAQADRTSKDTDAFIDIKNQILPRFRKERDGLLDDTVERSAGNRYGNASKVRLEIRYGKDNSVFQLVAIKIDYIKAPQHIRLTQEQIDLTEDTSQILEFPDYVCQEIINELTHIIMENGTDPRLQTHPVVSQSIASPAQEQTQTKK